MLMQHELTTQQCKHFRSRASKIDNRDKIIIMRIPVDLYQSWPI